MVTTLTPSCGFHLKNEYEWVLKNSGKRHIPDLAKSKVHT